jgi:hypothetical protein
VVGWFAANVGSDFNFFGIYKFNGMEAATVAIALFGIID